MVAFVTQSGQNGREECCETIERNVHRKLEDPARDCQLGLSRWTRNTPDLQGIPLRISQNLDDFAPRKLLIDTPMAILLVTDGYHSLFLLSQEPRCLWSLGKSEEKDRDNYDGQ